ncbi:MAG: poly-beta-1,6-N-acetyl-D-glucosamine N-deacetylase PgaB [Candidatus Omnitrophica bacterium]|nr:poly-beta-1,6-N-acetyl-D-glucosamine N-deacetylase PgaB [Candidatus Omnitrophota bacterium]
MKIGMKMMLCLGLLLWPWPIEAQDLVPQDVIVLCYHDVPLTVQPKDKFGVDQKTFVETIEYLKRHDYHFVSLEDLIQANEGKKPLPPRAVLLTFDDGYQSFYDFVYPLLKEYKIPCISAIVASWIDGAVPQDLTHSVMTWEQVREIASSPYVEVVSHSHDLHEGVVYNPQGNQAAAATSRIYDSEKTVYEDEVSYRQRIHEDLEKSKQALEEHLGRSIRAIAWPYGKYNHIAIQEGKKIGIPIHFLLNDQRATVKSLEEIPRFLIHRNPPLKELLSQWGVIPLATPEQKRIVQVDLDFIYDKDPKVREENLGRFLDRIKIMKPTAVYLQAFADPEGNGNIASVYFPNRVLPVREDFFSRVAHQLRTRAQVEVYAWMPMLSIVLPNEKLTQDLQVREWKDGEIVPTTSWYQRLSPFSPTTRDLLKMLYEDLALHCQVDGVVFQDDGYFNDFEDFHPDAVSYYQAVTGNTLKNPAEMSQEEMDDWTAVKTKILNDLSKELKDIVKFYLPEAKFTRTLYALTLQDSDSEEWFAQNYADSLKIYDYVMLMAYPKMEEISDGNRWLAGLVREAKAFPDGLKKTIFKVQTFDWKTNAWIPEEQVQGWLKSLVGAGAWNIGYYPDDYVTNHPSLKVIRGVISVEDFPFVRDWE